MAEQEHQRPSPEALLELAKAEEPQQRGKLTIYFGAAPGVGKTYAMLVDARRRRQENVDVVVAYVEAHGRRETEALLEGLEILPPLLVTYKNVPLKELDLDRVLARHPQLVLVDELAHTDAPGLRHQKRFQDVEEILNAGIDVYTTLNVQHLESLNDTIYRIIGIRVRETVPDSVLERVNEIKLVDLPPEELLVRLREGKVYAGELTGRATQNFFRPGNLLALRQLALRAVAGSVDEKMLHYMRAHAIAGPWPAQERVLAGVFASPYADKLVRAAFRLAGDLHAEWIAFYVETERHQNLSEREREWLNQALELARRLGARIVWMKGSDVTEEIVTYARNNNVTKIVIGKPRRFGLRNTVPLKIITGTPDIDVYLLDAKAEPGPAPRKRLILASPGKYAAGLFAVGLISLMAFLLRNTLNEVNLLFLMLVPVVLSAVYLGRGPTICAALASIIIFDYFFVPPYFAFNVSDVQYFLSFIIYIIVAMIVSDLASKLRDKITLLRRSESNCTALYGLSRDLVTAQNPDQVLAILVRHATQIFPGEMAIFLPTEGGLTVTANTAGFEIGSAGLGVASWVYLNQKPAGQNTSTFPAAPAMYLPMMAADGIMGVLTLATGVSQPITPENRAVLETLADLGAMALERMETK